MPQNIGKFSSKGGRSILDDGMISSFSAFVDKVGAGMRNTDYAKPIIFASG